MSRRRVAGIASAAGLAVAALLGAALPWQTPALGAEGAPTAASAEGADRATLALDAAAESRAGLALGAALAARGRGEIEAYGQVLDPVPLAEAVFARRAARAALEAARKEYARVKALHRGDANASTRELEAADVAFQRARLDLELAQARLASGWGAALAGRQDLDELVQGLAQRRMALARLDLPAGEALAGAPSAARVRPASARAAGDPAQLLGPAPSTDPSVQGHGFLVLLEPGPAPGTALVGRLTFPERSVRGVRVPRSAVVWRDGQAFVYVALGAGRFERRAVELHGQGDDERSWLVTGALAPGDPVVVSGAALLLSAEQTGGEGVD